MRVPVRTMGAIIICFVTGTCLAKTGHEISSLCSLQGKVPEGAHMKVLVSGIYAQGLENTTLTDSACPAQSTWVEFDLKTTNNETKLQNSLGVSRKAHVVFEGEFYGPPVPDPKLPEKLRKAFRPRWGHLACCQTKLVVHTIREVKAAPADHTNGASSKRTEGRDTSAAVEEAFAPEYPRVALAAQVQGTVRVKVTVAPDGSVSKAEALSGSPMLVPLVLEAAKKWKFEHERERTAELEFRFEALSSTAAKDQIGAVYMPPMTVLVRDRVPVIPDSPHAKSDEPKRETVLHEASHADGAVQQR